MSSYLKRVVRYILRLALYGSSFWYKFSSKPLKNIAFFIFSLTALVALRLQTIFMEASESRGQKYQANDRCIHHL